MAFPVADNERASQMEQWGLQYVRGCEVIEIKDEGASAPCLR